MNLDMPAHILVVEPDAALRDLLGQYLKKQGLLVSLGRDVDHARRLVAGLDFDLVLVDGASSGATDLGDAVSGPMIVMVADGASVPTGVTTIAKPFEPSALRDKINGLLDRRPPPAPIRPAVLHLGDLVFDIDRGLLHRAGEPVKLTAGEVALMRLLAADTGRPVPRKELAARLGREGAETKARAVDVQITRLRRKIEPDPKSPRYLQTVRGAGYMLVAG